MYPKHFHPYFDVDPLKIEKMIQMILVKELHSWMEETTTRTIQIQLPLSIEKQKEVLQTLKEAFMQAQSISFYRYVYTLQKAEPVFPKHKQNWPSLLRSLFQRVQRKTSLFSWNVTITKRQRDIVYPKHFRPYFDVDPLTPHILSTIGMEVDIDFSQYILLPKGGIAHAIGVVRTILERGEVAFRDPINDRLYEETDRATIFQQITDLFGVSKAQFLSCFYIPASIQEWQCLGLDKNGDYVPQAKEALARAIPGLKDPALSAIPDAIQKLIKIGLDAFNKDERFQSLLKINMGPLNGHLNLVRMDKIIARIFSIPDDSHICIALSKTYFFHTYIDLNPLMKLAIYKQFSPYLIHICPKPQFDQLKSELIRHIRVQILETMTSFFNEAEKEGRKEKRMEAFQALSGISLMEGSQIN